MANGMVMVMADEDGNCNGRWWRRRQWPTARASVTAMADGNTTEMVAAMIDRGRNGNGWWQRRWWQAIAMATAMAMATESAMATEMAMAMAMATATAMVTIMKEGLPLHVAEMCSSFGGGTPCLYPHGHKGKCIHQRCIMGVTLLRVFAPLQGGRFLTAHHGLFFVYFLQLLFSLLNNPLFAPCIIQLFKNLVSQLTLYLLHSSKNPVSLLTIYPGSYCAFCQGKPGQGLQWL
jgi:hypothetical protein